MSFDLRTHHRDSKSGRVTRTNLYAKVCSKGEGDQSEEMFERPPGSGLWFHPDGSMHEARSKEGLKKQLAAEAKQKELDRVSNLSPAELKKEQLNAARKLLAEHDAAEKAAKAPPVVEPKNELPVAPAAGALAQLASGGK